MNTTLYRFIAALATLLAGAVGPEALAAASPSSGLGDAANQLALDITPVPHGMGAVFVPSPSRPELEPAVHVFAGEDRVATGPTARRIALPPGHYTVVFGQGPFAWRARAEVTVEAGRTAVVDGFFSALRVTAIDRYDRPAAVRYVLASADGERVYGPERTAASVAEGATRTWIVAPGRYHIALGGDAERAADRVAVVLPAGARVDYRLVVDDGALVRSEFADREIEARDELWRMDWVLGGSMSFDRAENQLGGFSGEALRVEAFTRFEAGLDLGDHLLLGRVGIEESFIGLEHAVGRGLPFQKLTDVVQAEVLYNYRLASIAGPYVRGRVRTSAFPTILYPDGPTDVEVHRTNGDVETFTRGSGDEIRLMDGFAPTTLQAGGGMGVTLWDDDTLSLLVRGGVAVREDYYGPGRGLYVAEHGAGTLVLRELDRDRNLGVELTAALRLRLGAYVSLQSTLEAFASFDRIDGTEAFLPAFQWDNAAALQIASWASLVYSVVYHRDDARIGHTQLRHALSLRLQYSVF